METTTKQLFDTNFDFAFKATTYNNMNVALQTFEQFKRKNEDFFSFDKKETLFGHLRTYAIEKQFNDSAFNPKANYTVSMKQVNNYKHKVLCIETNDFIINVGRTNNQHSLLPASTYKKNYAKANAELNTQLLFNFINNQPTIIEEKKYAEITYGYQNGELTHLNILIPSSDYKSIEYSSNLLENIAVYENYVPKDIVEESIVKLKISLSQKMEKII